MPFRILEGVLDCQFFEKPFPCLDKSTSHKSKGVGSKNTCFVHFFFAGKDLQNRFEYHAHFSLFFLFLAGMLSLSQTLACIEARMVYSEPAEGRIVHGLNLGS